MPRVRPFQWLLLPLLLAHAVVGAWGSKLRRSSARASEDGPPNVILISSPMEKKVVYAELQDFKAVNGVIEPLIDAGLAGPAGIAYDQKYHGLFVTDPVQKKIFYYKIQVTPCTDASCKIGITVAVDGEQTTIVDGVASEWCAVDADGNLYFTDKVAKSVSKIERKVIKALIFGHMTAGDLVKVSEQVGEALTEAGASENLASALGTDHFGVAPVVMTLYEAGSSSHVGTPGGISVADGIVHWTNQAGGLAAGSVVEGPSSPKKSDLEGANTAPLNEAKDLAVNTEGAFGVVETHNSIVYTGDQHYVYTVSTNGNMKAYKLTDKMFSPRGLAWDGDSTVYLADKGNNIIYSVPCGRLVNGVSLGKVVSFHDPFGIAVIKSQAAPPRTMLTRLSDTMKAWLQGK